MTKLTVVFSQVFYPMSIGRYFEAALRRRDDINLITVGPYTGNMIPWNGGMALPQKYATAPNIVLPTGSPHVPIAFIENQLPVFIENRLTVLKSQLAAITNEMRTNSHPDTKSQLAGARENVENEIAELENRLRLPTLADLWLQIDAGFYLNGRPQHGKNVIVATDPHVLNYDRQRTMADTFYSMQACYAKPGDRYLPYAYDPIWHAPETQDRLFDVCLLGLHYANRNKLVDRLSQEGIKVYYDLGPSFDEARTIYNQAPIGLNWSSKDDLTARVFELLGMRRLAVVNEVPDLANFFRDGADLIAFRTLEEAVEKIQHYIANEDQLEALAQHGHTTVKPHTWDARVAQILQDL